MADEEESTVRIDNEDQRVWLVKVPPRVARQWDESKEEDALRGRLRFQDPAPGEIAPRITFHLPEDDTKASTLTISNDFTLKMQEEMAAPMRVFSKGDGGIEMVGVVENVFFMRPLQSQEYQSAVQYRVSQANRNPRTTKEIDSMRFKQRARVVKIVEEEDQAAKRRRTGADGGEDSLREAIFNLFARQDEDGQRITHWTFNDIKRELGLDEEGPLRKMVGHLCIYHGDGDYARKYELKPDFR